MTPFRLSVICFMWLNNFWHLLSYASIWATERLGKVVELSAPLRFCPSSYMSKNLPIIPGMMMPKLICRHSLRPIHLTIDHS